MTSPTCKQQHSLWGRSKTRPDYLTRKCFKNKYGTYYTLRMSIAKYFCLHAGNKIFLQSLHCRHYTAALCSQQSLALDRITFCEMASAAKRENVIPFFRFKRRLRRRWLLLLLNWRRRTIKLNIFKHGRRHVEGREGEDTTIWVDLRVYD